MIGRTRFLAANRPLRVLQDARRYLDDRKARAQRVGTYNVRYRVTSAGDPAWSGTLPPSPQAPSTGTRILKLTITAQTMTDLFCRVIPRLDVGGTRYTYANRLAAIKAGTSAYHLSSFFGSRSLDTPRNTVVAFIAVSGPVDASATVYAWIAANDDVDISVEEFI